MSEMSGRQTVRLPANADVRESASLKQELLLFLESPDVVLIDVTDVQRVDTATLQLLFAFCRDRLAGGRSTAWQGDSPALCGAAAALDLHVGPPAPCAAVGA
jgi:anti-anti-sigma regulatory factor